MTNTGTETAGLSPQRVGERLIAAREALGLSVDDIAERTRVPLRHLQTIEAGGTDGLPATPYSVGFVRTYASSVGLDPADLAQQFRGELGQAPVRATPEPFEPADPARVPTRLLAIVALLIAVAIGAGYAIWRGDSLSGSGAVERERLAAGSETILPGPPLTPVPGAATTMQAPAAATGPVTVTATSESWAKIYDGPTTLFLGIMAADQSFEVPAAAADPRIWTGQPQAFRITVGGRVAPPIGTPDRIVRDVSLKPDALFAAGTAPAADPSAAAPAPADPALRGRPLVTPPGAAPAPRP